MTATLQRRLGVLDAVTIGAGSMIGAGVFSAWGPATDAAGTGVLIGLVVAAVVAFCNATSSAQLAAVHPESGGTYVYARRQLSPTWGYLAGWGFVIGKTASCVAIALTAGAYLWPDHARLVGVGAVAAVAIVNLGGLTRTVLVTKALLAVALVTLGSVVIAGWSTPDDIAGTVDAHRHVAGRGVTGRRVPLLRVRRLRPHRHPRRGGPQPGNHDPQGDPRALAGVLVVYVVVGVTVLATLPTDAIAASDAPLGLVVTASRFDWLGPIVRIGAGIAALGVLLNLIPGVSRTVLAMARRRELPHWLATIDVRRSLPLRAEITVTAVVIALTATLDLRGAIGFSGVTILTYYAITNAACLTLPDDRRRWPRPIAVVGLAGCLTLAVMLPLTAVIAGSTVLVAGLAARATARRLRTSE